MKRRPLSIKLISVAFLLAPLFMTLELIYLYRIPLDQWYLVFNPQIWHAQAILVTVVTPLVGVCVWTVKRWAFPILVGWTVLILVNNLVIWIAGRSCSGVPERALMLAGIGLLFFVEARKQFQAPYFNPRLRWWEQAHRYGATRVKVRFKRYGSDELLFEAESHDISHTGVYAVTDHPVTLGEHFGVDVEFADGAVLHATAEVVWLHGDRDDKPIGFGCRFAACEPHFKHRLKQHVKAGRAAVRKRFFLVGRAVPSAPAGPEGRYVQGSATAPARPPAVGRSACGTLPSATAEAAEGRR